MLNTTSKNKTIRLSFREKSNYASLLMILLVFGYYFLMLMTDSGGSSTRAFVDLGVVTLVFILLQVSVQSILAGSYSAEALRQASELEHKASLKAHRVAYGVFVGGVFIALLLTLANVSAFWLFQSILFFFILAELVKYAVEIIVLRRTLTAVE